MHGLPETIDLSFFDGRRLEQVRLGEYQVQVVFDMQVSVDLESEFTLDGTRYGIGDAHVLHTLLGLSVKDWTRVGSGDVALSIGPHRLVLHDSNETYESYSVHNGQEVIVV